MHGVMEEVLHDAWVAMGINQLRKALSRSNDDVDEFQVLNLVQGNTSFGIVF